MMRPFDFSFSFFLCSLLIAALPVTMAIDEDACEDCVEDAGCGYCVVDGEEACVCDQSEFESGSRCNGGSKSFKTTASLGCSEEGRKILIIIGVIVIVLVIGCIVFLSWCCCCRRPRRQKDENNSEKQGETPMTIPAAPPSRYHGQDRKATRDSSDGGTWQNDDDA